MKTKDQVIAVRLYENQRNDIKTLATKAGMSVSEYTFYIIEAHLEAKK